MSRELVVCADVGSTYTKVALVDVDEGRLIARAEHRTTLDTDVLDGLDACVVQLTEVEPRAAGAEVLGCSSAGGGLRIAVVGNEELVTTEAGRRVALSSGGRVVHVAAAAAEWSDDPAGPDGPDAGRGLGRGVDRDALAASRPDVVLLVGGTDGGNAEVLLACARSLAGWPGPVVVAGNAEAVPEVARLLEEGGTPYVVAGNVVPRVGVLEPEPARRAIRAMFLSHVIGGKHLSGSPRFARCVVGATPDLVLTAVELLTARLAGRGSGTEDGTGVVVVDVGGATTDVYSVLTPVDDPDLTDETTREVVGAVPARRTVEGDLGMRWSAASTVEAAAASGLLPGPEVATMHASARSLQQEPGRVPVSAEEQHLDRSLAAWAVEVALRRHAGRAVGGAVERGGVDLRRCALLIGSGGALRHGSRPVELLSAHRDAGLGWLLPEEPRVVVDRDYVLAAAGLLATRHHEAAAALLDRLVATSSTGGTAGSGIS